MMMMKRYDIIKPIINKKLEIMKTIELDNISEGFYFEFCFDMSENIGLVYDYNFSYENKLEICYYDWRKIDEITQIRTCM